MYADHCYRVSVLISERKVLVECAIISEEAGSYFQPQRSGMGCGREALELSFKGSTGFPPYVESGRVEQYSRQ